MSALSEPLVHRPQRTKVDDCPEAPNDQHPHPHMQQDPPPSRRCLQSRAADSPSPENLGYDGNEVEQAENEYSYNYDDDAHHCHSIVTISMSAIGSRRVSTRMARRYLYINVISNHSSTVHCSSV